MRPKLLILSLLLALPVFAQQPTGVPSGITDPQPITPVKPGITKPVPAPQDTTPAPAMPSENRVLLRRIAMVEIPGRPGFQAVTIANGALLMAHPADATVDVFSLAKRRLIAQIKDMKGANGLAVDPKNGKLYVANTDADEIAVVSTSNWQVERRIPLKVSPTELLLASDTLYAANWRDLSISRVDLHNNTVNTAVVGGRPVALAFNPASRQLYASLEDRKQVIVLDPSLNVVQRFPVTASQPTGLAFDTQNRKLYVAVRYAVLALDADSGQELSRVAAPAGIDTLWLDAANHFLYGAAEGGSVLVMKTAGRLAVEREFSTDVKGHSIAFDAAKNLLYMPGGRDGRSKLLILRHVKAELPPAPEVAKRQ